MKFIFLGVVAPASVLFPLLIGFFNFQLMSKAGKTLMFYFGITLIANIVNEALNLNKISNLLIFHAYSPIEAWLLFRFFTYILSGHKILKLLQALKIVFPVYCVAVYLFFQNDTLLNSYTRSIEAILIIGLCMYYWWQSSTDESESSWPATPANWIVSGILIYFSSGLFYFVFSNVLRFSYNRDINIFILNINAIMIIIMNLLCAVGFYKLRKHER